MPGELTLAPRMTLNLEGTGTAFDQAYQIDSIERAAFGGRGLHPGRARELTVVSDGGATPPADTVGSITG